MKYIHSLKLFCNGVPVNTILLSDLIRLTAFDIAVLWFFNTCPSSHMIKSGPGSIRLSEIVGNLSIFLKLTTDLNN